MNRHIAYGLFILLAFVGCKSVSKFAIDQHAIVRTDSSLLGIWKVVEDTDKANYILVQSPNDLLFTEKEHADMDSGQRRSLYSKEELADSNMLKLISLNDTALNDAAYRRYREDEGYYYYLTYFSMHGRNPLEGAEAFHSEIRGEKFLNVTYYKGHDISEGEITKGYFFIHLISRNSSQDTLLIAAVADSTLMQLNNSKEVRKRIKKNLYNPSFYSDTLHLYKVSNYHLNENKSVEKAN